MARSRALANVLSLVNVEEVPVEQGFLRDLKASIEKDKLKEIHSASRTYKPSGMHCLRNMWFQMMGVEPLKESPSMELIGIGESGTDRHERIQNAVMKMVENGIDCEYVNVAEYVRSHGLEDELEIKDQKGNETKLYHRGLNISFLCDGVIRYNGKYYILEIKTEASTKFWDQKEVRPEHYLQGTAYSHCLKIDDVLFLYENRDTCGKKAFMLHVTDEMRDFLVNKILTCDSYVEKNTCPPKPDDVTKRDCLYCQYKQECAKYM